MSKLATCSAAVIVAVVMLHSQRTATSQPPLSPPDASVWRMSMGPNAGGNSGTQLGPATAGDRVAWWNENSMSPGKDDDAEYREERNACESLGGDARIHCLEYAKLRYGH